MIKIFTTRHSDNALNIAMLLFRLVFAGLLLIHGFQKLSNFQDAITHMPHFLGLSQKITLSLVIFAEFFCSLFLILGLFTRLLCIPIIINMGYIVFMLGDGTVQKSEVAILYLVGFLVLLLLGPGKFSLDNMLSGKR